VRSAILTFRGGRAGPSGRGDTDHAPDL